MSARISTRIWTAQRGVEVRERLVEAVDLGLAHEAAADGDALALPARELPRQAVEQRAELQHLGDAATASPARARALLDEQSGTRGSRAR
jgi:hypothetical protein